MGLLDIVVFEPVPPDVGQVKLKQISGVLVPGDKRWFECLELDPYVVIFMTAVTKTLFAERADVFTVFADAFFHGL